MTPKQKVVELLSDLAEHGHCEVSAICPPGQVDAILTSLTGPKIDIDGCKYWLAEDEPEPGQVVYQLVPVFII